MKNLITKQQWISIGFVSLIFMFYSMYRYGFIPLLFISQAIAVALEWIAYTWIMEHWKDKPYLKYTIGLAIIYFLGWELLFNILPSLFVG